MTVSTVIPTYERPEYLRGAIETALRQTYSDIEVVVVDDGSSERYADEIVSQFSEDILCVYHNENKGLSAARNTGIERSSGKYIAFLDDDDRWDKNKLARQVEALEKNKQVGMATCLVAAITPDNRLVHCEKSAPSGDFSDGILIGNQIGTPSRVVVSRECLDDIGRFDESLQTKQDWDFYIRLCQEWDIIAVNDHLCFRTVHDSMSSSPESSRRDNKKIIKKHEDLLRSRGYLKQSKAEVAQRVGRAYMNEDDLKRARKHFSKALKQDPSVKRVLLYMLTFTSSKMIHKLRAMKRRLTMYQSGCSSTDATQKGLPK
jgi:glycosyltransferase involved in cell wall biosynthesis